MDSVRVVHEGTWLYPSGAERVAREMARALDAPVTVGHSGDPEFWSDVDATFPFQHLNRRPYSWVPRPLKELSLGLAFRTLSFEEDVVISSGTTAKWWSPRTDQRHVHYCHSPPVRVFVEPAGNAVDATGRTGVGVVDRFYADLCDEMLSNSAFTADRVQKYYGRESRVVHPPVQTERFQNETPAEDPHFVMVGRLEEMKRTDVVARAFEDVDATLKLVGGGPLEKTCASRKNVEVLGTVSDDELRDLIATATGGIAFARREHCGMTPKEFQAAGKPVVVPDEPNLVNHVRDGETGVVVEPSEAGVREGIERVLEGEWDPGTIQSAASEWSVERFHDEMRDVVEGRERREVPS